MAKMWWRWMPAALVPVAIASAALVAPLSANAGVSLPTKTAEQVLALVAHEKVPSFSGSLSQVSELGFPSLPTTGGAAIGGDQDATAASILSLATASHTARVYVAGVDRLRVQVMERLAERDLVRNGSDVWLYSSASRTAVHATVPRHPLSNQSERADSSEIGSLSESVQTPEQVATKLLSAVRPTTDVAVGADVRVAGRSAYTLVLTPKDSSSLVKNVSIAVDSATGMPLSIEAFAKGQQKAAFGVSFTAIDISEPDAALFSFTPPAGTTVTQHTLPIGAHSIAKRPASSGGPAAIRQGDGLENSAMNPNRATRNVRTFGTGWATIVSMPVDSSTAKTLSSSTVNTMSTPVSGGRVVHTSLFTILLTDDGRLFAGAVSVGALQVAAASK